MRLEVCVGELMPIKPGHVSEPHPALGAQERLEALVLQQVVSEARAGAAPVVAVSTGERRLVGVSLHVVLQPLL